MPKLEVRGMKMSAAEEKRKIRRSDRVEAAPTSTIVSYERKKMTLSDYISVSFVYTVLGMAAIAFVALLTLIVTLQPIVGIALLVFCIVPTVGGYFWYKLDGGD